MKHFRVKIYFKIILIEIILAFVMNFLVPILANYPPHSEESAFQAQILDLSHTGQYILLTSMAIGLQLILCQFIFKNCFKYVKKFPDVSDEEVIKVRLETYKVNRRLLITIMSILIIVLLVLISMVTMNFWLMAKFTLVYFSLFFSGWIMQSTLLKTDLKDIIKSTYEIYPKVTLPYKQEKFYTSLLKDTLPLFLVILIVMSLLGYSLVQNQIGENNYYYYKQEMENLNLGRYPKSQILQELSTINLRNNTDYYFLITDDEQIFSNEDGYITDFFITYAKNFLEQNDGKVYEYFGISEQAYCQRLVLENGKEALVGFKYSTMSVPVVIDFAIASLIAFIIYSIIMLIWATNIGKNISEVAANLSHISKSKNLDFSTFLPVYSNDEVGLLSKSYNEIQEKTKRDIDEINENKDRLMEKERLATLGQMIGGVAHNMKTPIMSIAGATDGLEDLITEYRQSISDPEVSVQDHIEISNEMDTWVKKIKSYNSYMSDIITTVKGQAVNMNEQGDKQVFTLKEMLTRIQILMRHELKINHINFVVNNKLPETTKLFGNINSLIQVVNNLISNSIQSYPVIKETSLDASKEVDIAQRPIYLNIEDKNGNILISVEDKGSGIPEDVQKKLFKEMTTTKGHNGSGLGLFMSYSTIKGHFKGYLSFESKEGEGTTFYITLPQ